MLSRMKNNWKKSEAAVIVQQLLERKEAVGLFTGDSATTANSIVAIGWEQMPDVFSGKFGKRPHKISVAAFCLGYFTQVYDSDERNGMILAVCFMELMEEIQRHWKLYGLTETDEFVLQQPIEFYSSIQSSLERRSAYREGDP